MIEWGLVGNSHDASISIWNDDHLVYAKKFATSDHKVDQLQQLIKQYQYPDHITWYERPLLKTIRQFIAGQGFLLKENNIVNYLRERQVNCKSIDYVDHHLSHAAYAYYTQPDDDCAIICLDSIGEFETITIWHGKDNKLKKLHSQSYPHSLGLFYSAMTQRIGLTPQRDEYLLAEYAVAGDPHRLTNIMLNEIIDIPIVSGRPYINIKENLHRGCLWWRPELNTSEDIADIAAATQTCFEIALKKLSNWAHWQTGGKKLALAGGGALNRQAIDKITKDWPDISVPPNPGDPGSSVGCVLAKKQIKINNIETAWQ